MYIIALVLNLLSSYFIASIFGNFLIIFIAFFALVILNVEILSLFGAICDKNLMILTILNFIISLSFLFFNKNKNKNLKLLKPNFDFRRFKNALILDKSLIVLLIAFIFLLLISLFFAIVMPSLEPDSQTYHFIRAYEFAKQGSLSHIVTNDIRGIIMPINSEVIYAWMYCFKKNFHGYGILSYFSFILTVCAMWNIFEKFKYSYRKRLYAIFIFSSFSAVIVQMQSLQTDIVVGSLFITSLALFINDFVLFSALALAIAMGVKTTAIIGFIPFLTVLILYEIFVEKNKKINKIKKFLVYLVPLFLIFSSYNYILNYIRYNSLFSNRAAYLGHTFWGGIKGYFANLINFFFQSFDFTGFKWGYYLNDIILEIKSKVFYFLNIPLYLGCNAVQEKVNIIADEQIVGFGILGFLVFLPMAFLSLVKIFFNKNKKTIFLFILALSFVLNILFLARATAYMVYSIRFIVAFVCLSCPILIGVYKKRCFIKPIILFFCLFYMLLISTHNKRMPFNKVMNYLKEVNYNLEAFEEGCFNQKVVDVYIASIKIRQIIKEKYPNKKRILFLKQLISSHLYLKKLEKDGYKIDFLAVGKLDEEKIGDYDLIILENKVQPDNVFDVSEIEIKYQKKDEKIIFDDSHSLNCIYYFSNKKNKPKIQDAQERACFSYAFLIQNKKLKLDYSDKINLGEEGIDVEIFYFVKTK